VTEALADPANDDARARARARRIENWNAAVERLSGRVVPPITFYPALELDEMRRRIAGSTAPLMIASAHFSTYFLLLNLAPLLALPFIVLTTEEGVAFWRQNSALMPTSVRFVSALSPADLRSVRQRRCVLFCMADVASVGHANAFVPLLGRLRYLTLSWAKAATRLGCDVYPVIAHHKDGCLDVLIDHVPAGETDAYALAAEVIRRLDGFMKVDPSAWELAGLFTESHAMPDDYGSVLARRQMMLLAQGDVGIRSALMSVLSQGEDA